MNTIIPPAKVEYVKFGPIFGGYLAPYLDQNIGAGLGFLHEDSEAGVLNLNTGHKFNICKQFPSEHYRKLVNQLTEESAHMDGKETSRMVPNHLVVHKGSIYGVIKL